MKGINSVEPWSLPALIILRIFPGKRMKVRFKGGVVLRIGFEDYRKVVGVINCGHKPAGNYKDGILFDFYGYKLYVPFSKLRWMPGVLDKSSPYWHIGNIKGKVVLDIGGFIGESALYFLSRGAKKVIVSEPVEENVGIIEENLKINDVMDRVEIIPFGVGDRDGEVKINYDEFGADFGMNKGGKTATIKTRHIDYFLSLKPDIVKFNCEGCERFILYANKEKVKGILLWYVQTHGWNLEDRIKDFMLKLGFKTISEYRHKTRSTIYTYVFAK